MLQPFVHLHLHSEYSIIDSTVRINALIDACIAENMPAVAITDEMNLFAMVKFYQAACKKGIKPIIGADIWVCEAGGICGKVTLLVMNKTGFYNLSQLISEGWLRPRVNGKVAVLEDQLLSKQEGLILLAGGHQNYFQNLNINQLSEVLEHWKNVFGDRIFLEIQRLGRPEENQWIQQAIDAATQQGVGLVASNDVRFIHADDYEVHQARVGINLNEKLGSEVLDHLYTNGQSFKSIKEMNALFSDIPSALQNTWEIAQRCNLELTLGQPQLPTFPHSGNLSEADYLCKKSLEGLKARFETSAIPTEQQDQYVARLNAELEIILSTHFEGYFLIVADFIGWAKDQNIPVGPGRGSGAGSLVAYALNIIDIDPLKYGLLFERFLNSERISMPDFDIDFCMERRDEVIEYVAKQYGADQVSQIITFGTMAARAVVRDSARVRSLAPFVGDRIAKMIPNTLGITLEVASEQSDALRKALAEDDEIRGVMNLATRLEGLVRNAGKHAGGVVIAPTTITKFSPLYKDESDGEGTVTQFDKDDVETMGLVKFDFLGLRTLTIIQKAVDSINRRKTAETQAIAIEHIPLDDPKAFQILKNTDTLSIFQCESAGIRSWMGKMQPNCFEDIIALVALYRPGPLSSGMIDDFINRKAGKETFSFLHPDLEPILKETYGVFIYQEQVMQCAQILADYTLGEADLLRRAMGKKKPEEMAQQESIFLGRAMNNGVNETTAKKTFDFMAQFAEYGFNKSHSAAYALITYQTAWLKANHPIDFYMACMNVVLDNLDNIRELVKDAERRGIKVRPPNINDSKVQFSISDRQEIIWGLAAIKGFGRGPATIIEQAQNPEQPFSDLFDFCQRVPVNTIGRKGLEYLTLSGAFDCFKQDRAVLMETLPAAFREAEQQHTDNQTGQSSLFSGGTSQLTKLEYNPAPPMYIIEKLNQERALTGSYLTGHPFDYFAEDLKLCQCLTIQQLQQKCQDMRPNSHQQELSVVGEIELIRMRNTKRNREICEILIADQNGKLEVVVDQWMNLREEGVLKKGQILVFTGTPNFNERQGGVRLQVNKAMTLAAKRQECYAHIEIIVDPAKMTPQQRTFLVALKSDEEGIALQVRYQTETVQAMFHSPYKLPYLDKPWVIFRQLFPKSYRVHIK